MSLDFPNHLIDEGLLALVLKVINMHDKIVQKNVLQIMLNVCAYVDHSSSFRSQVIPCLPSVCELL